MKQLSLFLLCLFTVILLSCKTEKKDLTKPNTQNENTKTTSINEQPKTYAEISIAEGGKWNKNKYEGGTSFKNVNQLKVPDSHTDHSYYIRYEGPGWESNKVGYRLYLDWRNAIDVFGKKVEDISLKNVGQDGFDSYHENSDWGMDILKVGKALGIGSYGRLDNKKVHHFEEVDSTFVNVSNHKNESLININYHGWKTGETITDLKTSLSIAPDSRLTKATLETSKEISGLVTGIVRHDGTEIITCDDTDSNWSYIATYGKQTLVPDNLGMVVFYNKSEVEKTLEGEYDHLIVFKPTITPITYYFAAAWEQEKNGITSKKDFTNYLNKTLIKLNQ